MESMMDMQKLSSKHTLANGEAGQEARDEALGKLWSRYDEDEISTAKYLQDCVSLTDML
jgi:hypothetical protein